ncbi:MAG TPA: glutaredoxin family protein [Gallionella sp.]|nr:glutaredoxin family protein [Gallionella sp.]
MKRTILLLGCLAMMPLSIQADELFRWVDNQGRVHYGDVPPVDAAQVTPIKPIAVAEPGEDLPYEARRAQQNFPVTLYVADNCTEYCDQARSLLSKRGIPFSEKKLATREDIDAFKALSGFDSVPALAVGRTFLKGFLAEQWHSELDIAGYPKTAPYRPPVTPSESGALTVPAPAPAAASEVVPANPESAGQAEPANPNTQ